MLITEHRAEQETSIEERSRIEPTQAFSRPASYQYEYYLKRNHKIKNKDARPETRSMDINLAVWEIRANPTNGLINPPTKIIN